MFNDIYVTQSQRFVKLSCKTHISKILESHKWTKRTNASPLHSPMNHHKKYMADVKFTTRPTDTDPKIVLEKEMKFLYRQAIGELIFAVITCRPDILYSIIKLSQYNTKPAHIHYLDVKHVFKYLCDIIDDGIYYWRPTLQLDLPNLPWTTIPHDNHDVQILPSLLTQPVGFVDSYWAGNTSHCRSTSRICLCFAGAPVVYRSWFQPTVSLSSSEAGFIAATEAGRLILCLCSMLNDLDISQESATIIYKDNCAATSMTNASQPTHQTRHMDIKRLTLLDWVTTDQLILSAISTHDNLADSLTKFLGTQLCSRHTATTLGKRQPSYCTF